MYNFVELVIVDNIRLADLNRFLLSCLVNGEFNILFVRSKSVTTIISSPFRNVRDDLVSLE